ncbi:MAG TPA: hypothetical protein VHI52_05650, partial [Verrucomicrobiae bacterium]|nr:hypothetical protein [Verrucomicrobiae bacterium]
MNRSFAKEMRPLLLPWLIAAAGGLLPPGDELESVLGSVLSFGGFAVVAAMVYAIEFQERTLPLLLTQPVDRSRVWRDKLSVTALAAAALACLNWRVHSFLADIPLLDLGPVFGWVLLCAVICSAGFWIESTHSVLGGVALAFLVQLLVFLGLGIVAVRSVTLEGQGKEFFISFVNQVATCGVVYCAAFLWLSRQFWKKNAPAKAGVAALVIVLFGLGEIANAHAEAHADSLSTCGAAVFVLATICSAGWWALAARTTIGGAVLTIASQFIAVIAIRLVLSQLTGSDFSADDRRFWPIIFLGAPLYAALFLWGGWRKFLRLEAREPVYGEGAVAAGSAGGGPGWLRCRAGEHWLNLARKELRLQKPLLLLAGIFTVCWLALFG